MSLETSAGWPSAVMTLDVGGDVEAYTHAGQPSAYHLVIDFIAWAEHDDRTWSAAFVWSWAKVPKRNRTNRIRGGPDLYERRRYSVL